MNRNNQRIRTQELPKVALDIALTSAVLSISLAALCLALLSLSSQEPNQAAFVLSAVTRIALLILGGGFIYVSAILIDWVVDSFTLQQWKALDIDESDLRRHDQISARSKLFGGGYVGLSVCLTGLFFVIILQAPTLAKVYTTYALPDWALYLVACVGGGYVFIQMMTLNFGSSPLASGIFLLTIGFVVGAVFF